MAICASCHQQVSVLDYTHRPLVMLENVFRSPGSRIFICEKCGAQLTLTASSFVICRVIAALFAIPSAIGFARLQRAGRAVGRIPDRRLVAQLQDGLRPQLSACLWRGWGSFPRSQKSDLGNERMAHPSR